MQAIMAPKFLIYAQQWGKQEKHFLASFAEEADADRCRGDAELYLDVSLPGELWIVRKIAIRYPNHQPESPVRG